MSVITDLMQQVLPHASAWRLAGSGSAEVTAGTEVAKLYVALTGGQLRMAIGGVPGANQRESNYIPYSYAGGGAGVGVGIDIPAGASVSLPSFPSTGGEWGRLYIPPGLVNVSDITRGTITGPAVILNPSISLCGVAGGFSIILFGATVPSFIPTGPAEMLVNVRAVAFQAGLSVITPGISANCTLHQVHVFRSGQITRP